MMGGRPLLPKLHLFMSMGKSLSPAIQIMAIPSVGQRSLSNSDSRSGSFDTLQGGWRRGIPRMQYNVAREVIGLRRPQPNQREPVGSAGLFRILLHDEKHPPRRWPEAGGILLVSLMSGDLPYI
jgi:hypothetical protein